MPWCEATHTHAYTYTQGQIPQENLRKEGTVLGSWTEDHVVDFLCSGRTANTAAFGSMADVVAHSTQHLSEKDLRSTASFVQR